MRCYTGLTDDDDSVRVRRPAGRRRMTRRRHPPTAQSHAQAGVTWSSSRPRGDSAEVDPAQGCAGLLRDEESHQETRCLEDPLPQFQEGSEKKLLQGACLPAIGREKQLRKIVIAPAIEPREIVDPLHACVHRVGMQAQRARRPLHIEIGVGERS